jgi:hypothetical protein
MATSCEMILPELIEALALSVCCLFEFIVEIGTTISDLLFFSMTSAPLLKDCW